MPVYTTTLRDEPPQKSLDFVNNRVAKDLNQPPEVSETESDDEGSENILGRETMKKLSIERSQQGARDRKGKARSFHANMSGVPSYTQGAYPVPPSTQPNNTYAAGQSSAAYTQNTYAPKPPASGRSTGSSHGYALHAPAGGSHIPNYSNAGRFQPPSSGNKENLHINAQPTNYGPPNGYASTSSTPATQPLSQSQFSPSGNKKTMQLTPEMMNQKWGTILVQMNGVNGVQPQSHR